MPPPWLKRVQIAVLALVAAAVLIGSAGADDALPFQDAITVEATSADGAVVEFPEPGKAAENCNPGSGATFGLGDTTVTCDGGSFTVHVVDTTKPVFDPLPAPSAEATSTLGATVNYDAPTATDLFSRHVSCDHEPGTTFPLGSTTVNCTATDVNGNAADASFTVTVVDTTKPDLGPLPASITNEATSTAGATATFDTPAAADIFLAAVVCTPGSGSTFPLGTTSVICKANDTTGNIRSDSFTVTVQDRTKPVLATPVPPAPAEATAAAGAPVAYTQPSATDIFPVGVDCAPASGAVFAIGSTTVTCTARDANGNTDSKTFTIIVKDSTPPTIATPAPITVTAPDASGATVAFGVTALDIVDGPVPVTCAPASGETFAVGATTVRCNAKDARGNAAPAASFVVTVKPPPASGSTTPAPTQPTPTTTTAPFQPPVLKPSPPASLAAKPGDRRVTLTWSPLPVSGTHIEIRKSGGGSDAVVYSGTASSLIAAKLKNGIRYTFVATVVDARGNRSDPATIRATPKAQLLVAPPNGARVLVPPMLVWVPSTGASYYNVQVFRNGTKILSVWPGRNRFTMKRVWTFGGAKRTLSPGVYHWYVWPGFGAHRDRKYGAVIGDSSFQLGG